MAGEVFFKNGHMDFDWRSTASMVGGLAFSSGGWGVLVIYCRGDVWGSLLEDRGKRAVQSDFVCRRPPWGGRQRWIVGIFGGASQTASPKHNFQWDACNWPILGLNKVAILL